ncbi:MAG: YbaK/EbsC family protein [Desulfosarcina sp.]|nr:YbaK/EbsC family protein [Desulfobacterales bacterium]
MAEPLTRADLQQFIDSHGIDAGILPLNAHTATVSDAARVLGVATGQIIKSLVFLNTGDPLLVINNGLARVDRKKLAVFLGVGRKRVKFATAEQALAITGYVVGSMPPFGHRQKLPTLVDPAVTTQDTVYGGGGALDAMLRLTPAELLRITAAEVVTVAEEEKTPL